MNYKKYSDADLAGKVRGMTNALSAHKITCLDNALADALAAEIDPINAAYQADIQESSVITAQKQAINERKSERRSVIINRLSTVQRFIEANNGPDSDYAVCGLRSRRPWTSVSAKKPDKVSATGNWTSGNNLKFAGNNRRGQVNYEIWRREGKTGEWHLAGVTKRQSFSDKTATPGQCYQYKVRAVAARSVSVFSNTAIVYAV